MRIYLKLIKLKNKKILLPIIMAMIIPMVVVLFYKEYANVSIENFIILKQTMPELGLQFFYIIQDAGLSLIFFILLIILAPNIIASDFLEMNNSKFANSIVARIGNKNKIKYELLVTFIYSFVLTVLLNIIILCTIQLFCFDLHFNQVVSPNNTYDLSIIFSNNQFLSLVIYILLSSTGYGVFSCFVYSLQGLVKNIYLYRAIGLFLGIVLVILPSFISQIYKIEFISSLIYFLSIWSILTPGIGLSLQVTPIIQFCGSIFLYILITLLILMIKEKTEKYYGN